MAKKAFNTILRNSVKGVRQDLVFVGRRLFELGIVSGTSGNISALVPGTKTALVKKTGVCLGDAQPEDFLLIDLDGNVLAGEGLPSKECQFHVDLYRARPDVGAVIHGHSPHLITLSIISEELPLLTLPSKIYLGRVPKVPAFPPASAELASAIVGVLSDSSMKAVLMEAHGFTLVGPNIIQASHLAGVLEDAAKVACLVKQLS
jgi:ribulose-5-phosphate 4-epimerase/fuculose-1-phosphate aldolase